MGGLLPKPVTTKEIQDGKSQTGHYAFGVSSMQGWRPAMEDAHMAIPDFDPERELGLFGVFDGHGGAAVAKVAAERFPETLRALPAFKQGRYSEALYESFLKLDSFLDSPAGREKVKEATPAPVDSQMEEEELLRLLESGELDPDDLDLEEDEEVEEEAAEEDEAEEASGSSSDWANAEGPDGMGCTAVIHDWDVMAPKKKEGSAADVLQDGPEEEEEAGPGKVVIQISAEGVQNLPRELQTLLGFSGFCKEFRTGASSESGWEFSKDAVIRLQNQETADLYNDVVQRPLVLSVRDAAAENALIGSAELSLVPLLHSVTEVTTQAELKLEPEYYAKWWKDAWGSVNARRRCRCCGSAQRSQEVNVTCGLGCSAQEREPLFEGETPPATVLSVTVRADTLIGPEEDRDCWTTLTMDVAGIFALPESLRTLGVSSSFLNAHPINYQGMLLGESLGEGALTKATEVAAKCTKRC
eukprot:s2732_g6.t1